MEFPTSEDLNSVAWLKQQIPQLSPAAENCGP